MPSSSRYSSWCSGAEVLRKNFPALFIGFPGDEAVFGGCLSSGRGFIHVSATGDLEPCPAAPLSDANLTRMPLRQALQSRFLREIRRHHEELTETKGGCSLWTNREWAGSVLRESRGGGPERSGEADASR